MCALFINPLIRGISLDLFHGGHHLQHWSSYPVLILVFTGYLGLHLVLGLLIRVSYCFNMEDWCSLQWIVTSCCCFISSINSRITRIVNCIAASLIDWACEMISRMIRCITLFVCSAKTVPAHITLIERTASWSVIVIVIHLFRLTISVALLNEWVKNIIEDYNGLLSNYLSLIIAFCVVWW